MPFLFFQVTAWHHRIKLTVVGLENGLEGIKRAGYDLSFHSWPGNGYGCERLKNKKIGHPQNNKQDRQDTKRTGIWIPMQTLIIHSGINL